jgi:hypothetical protein
MLPLPSPLPRLICIHSKYDKNENKKKIKGTVSRKSWRDKAMVSKSRLQLRIATGFKNFLISPLIKAIFQRFHFA